MNAHNTIRRPKVELILVTPELAEDWLAHANFERQRRRAAWHVERLSREISAGQFTEGTQIHFAELDGNRKLVNGQHTLASVIASGLSLYLSVLTTYVQSEGEIGALYGRHDRHRGRTPHDAFLAAGLPNQLGLEVPEVNALGAAIKYVEAGFTRPSVNKFPEIGSVDWLSKTMLKWQSHAHLYFGCVRDARYGLKAAFRRAPVVAVGIVTVANPKIKDRAIDFWSGSASDDGLLKNDPRKTLNQFLTTTSTVRGDPVVYMRTVASAWNKFLEGGELTFLRPGDAGKVGVTIRGTSFKAKHVKRTVKQAVVEDDDEPVSEAPSQMALGEAVL